MIKSGEIIRVKKGIYVKADEPFHEFILANLIYGPSYVSEDSALSWYGFIPERTEAVTSVTHSKSKEFSTPVGRFIYDVIPLSLYWVGVRRQIVDDQRSFLIASPEKALFDRLYRAKRKFSSKVSLKSYLFEDMRLDEELFAKLQLEPLAEFSGQIKKSFLDYLIELIQEQKK